jgi:DNA-binding NtrC family response regulator
MPHLESLGWRRIGTVHACRRRVECNGSILVVDDELATREMVVELLREEGVEAHSAASVDEALEALRQGDFEAVLSDIHMPDKDGFALLSELRQRGNAIPVILMTSFGTEETAHQAVAAGAFDCLLKPFPRAQLLEIVHRALRAKAELDDPVTCP